MKLLSTQKEIDRIKCCKEFLQFFNFSINQINTNNVEEEKLDNIINQV